jgi:hypothetical protein
MEVIWLRKQQIVIGRFVLDVPRNQHGILKKNITTMKIQEKLPGSLYIAVDLVTFIYLEIKQNKGFP